MRPTAYARTLGLLLFVLAGAGAARAQECLSYDPAPVELTGTISRKTFPGPPNYRSVRRGDRPETFWVLHLDRATCVTGNADETNEPERNVTDLQLVLDEKQYARVRTLGGKRIRVVAKGKLFHAHTAHHRTKVLLAVEDIRRG